MSTETAESGAPAADPTAAAMDQSIGGSVSDLEAVLGLESETAGDPDKAASKAPNAKPDAKAKAADTPAEEDPDVAEIKAITGRAIKRLNERRARDAARAPAPAATPAPAAAAPPAKPEAAPSAAAATSSTAKAVEDVLKQIAALAGADDDAAAANAQGAVPDTSAAERKTALAGLQAKVEELVAASKEGDPELKKNVEEMREQLQRFQDERKVRQHITVRLDAIDDKLPTLNDPSTLRGSDLRRKDGTRYRSAVEVVEDAVARHYDKFKTIPDVQALALRIEKKLAAGRPENPETPKPKRKTVSSSLSSPPAARTGPDTRDSKQVEADLFAAFPDA